MAAISGLILAGGAGRRAGGQDKGLLPWHGKPIVAHVAGLLAPQVLQLYISCNRNADHYARYGRVIRGDLRDGFAGPLAGLEAAAGVIATELLAIAPCDMPLLPQDLVAGLEAALRDEPRLDLVFAHDGERDQYLCALLRTGCLASLPPFLDGGGRAVHAWYAQLAAQAVDFSSHRSCFRNLNEL